MKKVISVLQAFAVYFWISLLLRSDAISAPYLVVFGVGAFAWAQNLRTQTPFRSRADSWLTRGFAALLAVCSCFADYDSLINAVIPSYAGRIFAVCWRLGSTLLCTAGGYVIFYQIFRWICTGSYRVLPKRENRRLRSRYVFAIAFVVIAVVDLTILFTAYYPGVLTYDSVTQYGQIVNGRYSNWHPYYHTQLIRVFYVIGMRLTGSINTAVALYTVFQALVMAACFAYAVMTVYELTNGSRIVIPLLLWFALMPFHILYSFTVWKDVLFGAMVLLLCISLLRLLRSPERKHPLDFVLLVLSTLCMSLFRSNGWLAFTACILVFAILFGREQKRLLLTMVLVAVAAFLLKSPVLNALEVTQPSFTESLSVPLQQIARVIYDGQELTEAETEAVGKFLNPEEVPEAYKDYISNPVKNLASTPEHLQYLEAHKAEFLMTWLRLGLRYPVEYIEAWIDQTRGYWNAGYRYWYVANAIEENSMGIVQIEQSARIQSLQNEYLWLFSETPLEIFLCIGFHVWLLLAALFRALVRRDRLSLLLAAPVVMILGTLLLATPVYSEFRYIYALFCCLPVVLAAAACSLVPAAPGEQNEAEENMRTEEEACTDGSDCSVDTLL